MVTSCEIASACLAASACLTRMCSSARSPVPRQVAAATFTPASLIAVATRASAPGAFSMSMTKSTAIAVRRQPNRWKASAANRDRGWLPVLEQRRREDHDRPVAKVRCEVLNARLLDQPLPCPDLRGVPRGDAADELRVLVGRAAVHGHRALLHRIRERSRLDVRGLRAGMHM